jgi:hypothetical protein
MCRKRKTGRKGKGIERIEGKIRKREKADSGIAKVPEPAQRENKIRSKKL